jgi:hypothetical protein
VSVNKSVAQSLPVGSKASDVARKIGEQWRAMSAADKSQFQQQSEREMAQWKEKLTTWADAHPNATLQRPSMALKTVVGELKRKASSKTPGKRGVKKARAPAVRKSSQRKA